MSNSKIITKEVIADTLADLSKTNDATLESCIKSLTAIKESKKISLSNLENLTNVWRELDSLREIFYLRILASLKRGDMVKG